ncbi:MAG TPA: GDP-mannose 4,6-dehydratase [candidate division Zixibacteria bacterium]|nr:GDP-mannose 4,6-dehydratase [candidate division Zixibacteria bacterium]HBZ01892.1 GDP-mannose 4,6-dehydratase [candidate division Zixibacteria bacterium]
MKAFITGIAGFAGRHLTAYLLNRGDEVAGMEPEDTEDLDLLAKAHDIKIYFGDIRDEKAISKALNQYKPDTIFHLAAQSSVRLSFENPQETFSVNMMGTLTLLEEANKTDFPIKTLVITSSEVYGPLTPDEVPVTEDHLLRPVNPYAVSKAAVDLLAYQYVKAYNQQVFIARAFSHSGPWQKTVGVLSDWAFQIAKIDLGLSQPTIKVGNLNVRRDYADVRDIVRGYVDIIEKGKPGEPYNVCSGIGYELAELLEKYRQFSSKKINIVVDQSRMRPVDIPILVGSNAKIKEDTGWSPNISIDTTLKDIYDYWREYLVEEV